MQQSRHICSRRVKKNIYIFFFFPHRVSVESESCALLSPVGVNDVFIEPRECLAAHCPIHQRYG